LTGGDKDSEQADCRDVVAVVELEEEVVMLLVE